MCRQSIKPFYISVLLCLFAQFAWGQFELGIFAGVAVHVPSTSNNAQSGIESATDYMVGISPGYNLSDKFKVLADVKILKKRF